jgi:lipase chaperone LimK
LIDRSLLDTAARQRLRDEEAAQAQWLTQLDATRHDVGALQNAPQLSAVQRDQAVRALIDERYAGTDRLRVRALLGL